MATRYICQSLKDDLQLDIWVLLMISNRKGACWTLIQDFQSFTRHLADCLVISTISWHVSDADAQGYVMILNRDVRYQSRPFHQLSAVYAEVTYVMSSSAFSCSMLKEI